MRNPMVFYRLHAWAALAWLLLVVPSWYLWRNSLFWILAVSLYANFISHVSAWQAVRAELVAGRAEAEAARVSATVDARTEEMLQRIIEAVEENGNGKAP
jgi:uncharacterized protein involved in cysteine biosynthesis